MSVVSKNPFDLLGDDGDESPAPVATKSAAAKKADTPAPAREVPGSGAPKPAGANATRGGRYPGRGGPRNVYRGDEPRNTGPTSGDGVAEGAENAGGFDGERVPPSRKGNHNHIRDAHTKGPRGSRPVKNYTSGGHSSNRGAGGGGGSGRTPNQGGERRTFERRSGTLPDSQKRIDQGWGANEGEAELNAEVQGERDAVVEENAPQTPAPEGEAPVEADEAGAAAEEIAEPAEPEEVQKSYDDYLAERAAAALAGIGKKEGRQVTAESLEGSQFVREGVQEFYAAGKEKSTTKPKAPKKEKVFIEFDGQFASPPGGDRGRGGSRGGDRGGRGGGRGRGEGRGGPRGGRGARGGRGRGGPGGANINANDEASFPALGA